jgi:hypothetical protein
MKFAALFLALLCTWYGTPLPKQTPKQFALPSSRAWMTPKKGKNTLKKYERVPRPEYCEPWTNPCAQRSVNFV